MRLLVLAALLALAPAAHGQARQVVLDRFGGLNDTDPSASLQPYEAQDALNVESSLSGSAILKRSGFSRLFTLTVATAPVNGSFSFVDANGSRQDIVCHDHYCAKSTNGASFSVFLSTAGGNSCIPRRWSFVQINGTAYGANDCRDAILSYNGTTLQSPATMPAGSVLELTKDRLVVADVAANPNSAYYSQSGAYTTFTTGLNSADPYTDPIGSPGDKTSALKYALGRLYIFKTTSITSCILGDQYSSRCFPVSNTIGTNDPLSIVEVPGAVYFRGNDRNYWRLDESGLTVVSKRISQFVASQTAGSIQNNTQTSQADWQAGTQTPASSWNTTISAGSVFPSSATLFETSGADFSSGTLVGLSTNNVSGTLTLIRSTFAFSNGDFTLETVSGGQPSTTNWDMTNGNWVVSGDKLGDTGVCGYTTLSHRVSIAPHLDFTSYTALLEVLDQNQVPIKACNAVYNCAVVPCAYTSSTCDGVQTVADTANGKNNRIFTVNTSTLPTGSVYARVTVNGWKELTTSAPKPQQVSIQLGAWDEVGEGIALYAYACSTINYVASGSRTSQIFDTAYSTPIFGVMSATFTATTGESNVAFYTQTSTAADGGGFSTVATTSDTLRITSPAARYLRYRQDFNSTVSTKTPSLQEASLNAATTGQFVTACIQPGAGISAWGILSCAQMTAGAGSEVFYATSAASCAALPTTAPLTAAGALQSGWTAQTNNTTLSVSTNAAVYIAFRSLLGSATDQAQVDACSLYWNNGVAAPPSWGTYDSLKNSIYWTSSVSNSSTNNRVLKYDLNLDFWYPFALNANAIRSIQNTTYFGDSTGGYWNQYGGVSSDNGAAITAYWKSKDFGGDTPFVDKNFNRVSLITKNQTTGSLTVTYGLSNNTTGSYSVSLSTTSGITYVHANAALPLLSPYQFMNIKIGNTTATPFEVDGLLLDFSSLPWKPQNP